MVRYSNEIKETMVKKLCLPGAPSALQLSKETGISQPALSRWIRQFGGGVTKKSRRPEDWSPKERLQAVIESQGLGELELGEFLRKNGLHSHHIEDWKKEALSGLAPQAKRPRGRPKKDPELVAALEENKLLKRDIRRKDRALAEQTALVILQKKVQALWGDDEENE
jgi:transposase